MSKCEICGVEDVLMEVEMPDGEVFSLCPEHFEGLIESKLGNCAKNEERQRIIELLEKMIEKVKENNMKDEGGDEHYAGQKCALKKLKQKLEGEKDG